MRGRASVHFVRVRFSVAWRDGCGRVHVEGVKQAEGTLGQGWLLRPPASNNTASADVSRGALDEEAKQLLLQQEEQRVTASTAAEAEEAEALGALRSQHYDNVTEDEDAQEKFRQIEKACFSGDVSTALPSFFRPPHASRLFEQDKGRGI